MASPRKPLYQHPIAWVLIMGVYIGLGITVKSVVLNWIIGPAWPVLLLYVIPRALRRDKTADA
jgi:hypothetical protein